MWTADLPCGARLRLVGPQDAEELYAVIVANREHLARWLPWAAGQTLEGVIGYIERAEAKDAAREGFEAVVLQQGSIVGMVGHTDFSRKHASTEVGYWLAEGAQGSGTMTQAVSALVETAFEQWGLHRVQIRVAAGNTRSRAIPLRLGFREEGVLREAERTEDGYADDVVYGLLASDPRAS